MDNVRVTFLLQQPRIGRLDCAGTYRKLYEMQFKPITPGQSTPSLLEVFFP